jgi:hypothetical protein
MFMLTATDEAAFAPASAIPQADHCLDLDFHPGHHLINAAFADAPEGVHSAPAAWR